MQNLLSAGAREKYNNIKLVKPEKAHNICNTILQMAQRGEIKGKVSPQRFDSILNSVGGGSKINITIARKKYSSDDNGFDSDEDYLNDL